MTDHELDKHILNGLRRHHPAPSYVVANCVCLDGNGRHPARKILARLRAMEKRGEVECLGFRGNNYTWTLPTA